MHTQLGARLGPAIPRSLHITGTVGEWEAWTQMRFPETGDYVFPAGLATVHIDRDNDTGEYWEPNIWIIHHISSDGAHLTRQTPGQLLSQAASVGYQGLACHVVGRG